MSRERLTVVLPRRLPEPVETAMAALCDLVKREDEGPMSRDEMIAAVRQADVLVPTMAERIDAPFLAEAGARLRLIANFGARVDHIDLAGARRRGILVTHAPDIATGDIADMAMTLILALTRRFPEGRALIRTNEWAGWSPAGPLGRRLDGRCLGILGMGRVGQALARRARAFGMDIHYHNRNPVPDAIAEELGATCWPSLDQMAARVDVMSVNCPATPGTFRLMNARRLALMKPGAVIVSTALGEVVDEVALTRMLRAGRLAGAGLDIRDADTGFNPRLRALDNVVLLPNMGAATLEGRIETGKRVIASIAAFAEGLAVPDRADAAAP